MKKVILVPDSFKGTMSSLEVCEVMENTVKKCFPEAETIKVPVADGGEGTVDAFLQAVGGEKLAATVTGPRFKPIQSFYGLLPDKTAVIEMAAAAGLPLMNGQLDAGGTTTYGVGELIRLAAENGCERIVLGLGGSATNDGGCGAAAALGIVFRKADGSEFIPTGSTLSEICTIDSSGLLPQLSSISCVTMCDIDNPLCGDNGAAAVFGPQKGADESLVRRLDNGLANMAAIIRRDIDRDIANLPGAGAAGGMGGGMAAFLNSPLQAGIETVLDTVHFDTLLENADLVLSGEGKFDSQSLRGKVVIGVAGRAKKARIPLICLAGAIEPPLDEAYQLGVTAAFSINRAPIAYEAAILHSKENLALMLENILRVWSAH